MQKPRTHYDNLKVPHTASSEEIRAAYKRLALQHHPDRNPRQREEANRIMQILNASYAVLNDPEKRANHDQWIARTEMEATRAANIAAAAAAARAAAARARVPRPRATVGAAAQWNAERLARTQPRERESSTAGVSFRVIAVIFFVIIRLAMSGGCSHSSSPASSPYSPGNFSPDSFRP